jgi:hypothetical protein
METRPKMEQNGTTSRNGLFPKKSFILHLPCTKHQKIEQIKPHFFYHFLSLKMSLSAANKVKCLLGLRGQ